MKALCWQGKNKVGVETVPDARIINQGDVIVRITSTAICGSDLHLVNGRVPTMQRGDILGHEFMGEVVEIGKSVKKLKKGDRVVVPFTISCGKCWFCTHNLWSACDNTNPNAAALEALTGQTGSGVFGYSHLYGGYAGGQAEYARVPYADYGPHVVPSSFTDEQLLFLTDIFPTGYEAAVNAEIGPGDTVAVWGCGPVGQFAIRSAFMLGAERVIAIDQIPERLAMAGLAGAELLDYSGTDDLVERLKQMTGGRGPDRCIDAVGMEAHGTSIYGKVERAKQALKLEFDNATVLRQAIQACRKGGTVSVPGVYLGHIDKFPYGVAFGKGLTLKGGQCNVQRYIPQLIGLIESGAIDPSFVITHKAPLARAADMYDMFKHKKDGCIKVVLKP